MPDTRKELLELYIAEQLRRVSAGTDVTTEMLQRSREQIAKSLDILGSTEVPKLWHPKAPSALIVMVGSSSHTENMGRGVSLATNRE